MRSLKKKRRIQVLTAAGLALVLAAVLIGYGFRDGRFEARDLLAKHDETYMPREVMDTLKETGVYQDPNS